MPERLATCCYCGRRTVMRVAEHSLACGSCGAPLSRMKPLRSEQAAQIASHAPRRQPAKRSETPQPRRKKRKPIWAKIVAEVWDEIEDIFD